MQVWTMVSGKAAVMAYGKPFSRSTTAIRMSWTPRLRSSVITDNQNLAPSVSAIQRPRTSRSPSRVTPRAMSFSCAMSPQRIDATSSIRAAVSNWKRRAMGR